MQLLMKSANMSSSYPIYGKSFRLKLHQKVCCFAIAFKCKLSLKLTVLVLKHKTNLSFHIKVD